MKKVLSTLDPVATGFVGSLLEQSGIEFTVRNQYSSGAMGELPVTECWPEIWVINDEDYEAAQEIARQATADTNDKAKPWLCACGEQIEAQFASCWNCGGVRTE